MKSIFLTVVLSLGFGVSAFAQGSDFPIPRLKGLYSYQNHFHVPSIRRAETVPSETPAGKKRLKELRAQGYSCLRKDPETRLCSKVWTPSETPSGLDESVKKFMTGIQVEFEGGKNPPVLVHDGSSSQEWEVLEKVKVVQTQVGVYRVVRNNKGQIYVVFPVNENQPLGPLLFHEEAKLGLQAIANSRDSETSTVAYTVEAFLEK